MSSGESWALSVIPELIARRGEDITVIVDEPESYLNEQLVSQFWSVRPILPVILQWLSTHMYE